jgi:hypothetical protein
MHGRNCIGLCIVGPERFDVVSFVQNGWKVTYSGRTDQFVPVAPDIYRYKYFILAQTALYQAKPLCTGMIDFVPFETTFYRYHPLYSGIIRFVAVEKRLNGRIDDRVF